jgi:hypothetical protein
MMKKSKRQSKWEENEEGLSGQLAAQAEEATMDFSEEGGIGLEAFDDEEIIDLDDVIEMSDEEDELNLSVEFLDSESESDEADNPFVDKTASAVEDEVLVDDLLHEFSIDEEDSLHVDPFVGIERSTKTVAKKESPILKDVDAKPISVEELPDEPLKERQPASEMAGLSEQLETLASEAPSADKPKPVEAVGLESALLRQAEGSEISLPAEEKKMEASGSRAETVAESALMEEFVSRIESRLLETVREIVESKLPEVVKSVLREEIERLKGESLNE